MMPWQMVAKMDQSGPEMHLLDENPFLLEGDLLLVEEDLLEGSQIPLLQLADVQIHQFVAELILRPLGEGLDLLAEVVLLPLPQDVSDHLREHPHEGYVAALYVGVLQFHLGGVLQDVLEVLQEGLQLVADAAVLLLGGPFVLHHVPPLQEEVVVRQAGVADHLPILHLLVHAGDLHEGFLVAAVLGGL